MALLLVLAAGREGHPLRVAAAWAQEAAAETPAETPAETSPKAAPPAADAPAQPAEAAAPESAAAPATPEAEAPATPQAAAPGSSGEETPTAETPAAETPTAETPTESAAPATPAADGAAEAAAPEAGSAPAPAVPADAAPPEAPAPKVDWAQVPNPVRANDASIERGRKLYLGKALCVLCHGEQGDGFGPLRRQFNPYPNAFLEPDWQDGFSDGQIMGVMREGKYGTGMVPFVPDFITEAEAWDVINYVRTFKGKSTEAYERAKAEAAAPPKPEEEAAP